MIEVKNLSKTFDDIHAIDCVSAEMKTGAVFGLIGSNGAGKSTFLRMLAGVLKQDKGVVLIDGKHVYENIAVKSRCFFIPDEQYFFPNSTPEGMMRYYRGIYPRFDTGRFENLISNFGLSKSRKISTFSKGMKKQTAVILAVCSGTDYIFCDETFDGLDPVARQAVKSLFAADIADRNLTPIIASHNLRELEDICDHVGLLHKGGILFSRDLEDMKLGIHKLQCAFTEPVTREAFNGLDIVRFEQRASLFTLTVRGKRDEIETAVAAMKPIFLEMLPLSLEEIFITETEVQGYDIQKLIF